MREVTDERGSNETLSAIIWPGLLMRRRSEEVRVRTVSRASGGLAPNIFFGKMD